uniref:hypothetical protein n=1 Tax=Lysinibacillus sp. D3C2_S12 TaxID=2941226 RepID=UPI0020C17F97
MTPIGTLNDQDIFNFCEQGILITENFSKKNVKQACYELTASNIYYDNSNSYQKYNLIDGDYILIKPKQIVVILTAET